MDIRKKQIYKRIVTGILIFIGIGLCVYLLVYAPEKGDAFVDSWGAILTLIGAVIVLWEIRQSKTINEAELVIRINSEFINNQELVNIEHKFEKYFYQYNLIESKKDMEQEFDVKVKLDNKKKMKKKERKRLKEMKKIKTVSDIKLELDLDIDSHERQELVNYLVHLESVASLVNTRTLRLEAISDLVAYRYFIAVNNPYVQKYELIPYKEYYAGCYKIYNKWKKLMEDKNMTVPMGKNGGIFKEFDLRHKGI